MPGNLSANIHKYGAAVVVEESEIPTPRDGEVVVRMKVRPYNPADGFSHKGIYPGFQPPALPAPFGLEGMGVIHTLGNGVSGLKPGDRVVPLLLDLPRSFQEYLTCSAANVVPVPDDVSDEVACQLVVNPSTAWGLLERSKAKKGDYILQSGASTEVGRMVIIAAKARGLKTINLVRRRELIDELKAIGADHVICTADEPKFHEKVKEITNGAGAHTAFDCVYGDIAMEIQESLRNGGSMYLYGFLGGMRAEIDGIACLFRDVKVKGFWVTPLINNMGQEQRKKMFDETIGWLKMDHFGKHLGKKFPLREINEAMKASEEAAKPGKVLLLSEF